MDADAIGHLTSWKLILNTDASYSGLSVVLMQYHNGKPRPISYASRLSQQDRNFFLR